MADENQRKKKICICIPNFSGGGAETVMITLMQSFAEAHDVLCVVAENKGPLRKSIPETCRLINLNSKSARRSAFPIAKVIRSEKPDIIISTLAYFNFTVLIAVLLSGYRPERVVVREANTPDATLKSLPSERIGKILYRILYNFADCVICNAAFIGVRLESLGVCPRRIAVIPNPVDVSKVRELASCNIDLPNFKNSSLHTFVSIGRLTRQKGMDRLIDWFSQMESNANLLIIGSGSEYQALIEQIKKETLEDYVMILEYAENPFPLMSWADAVILGSRWEGLPNVALEAMAIGKPVYVSSECESLAELKTSHNIPQLMVADSKDGVVDLLNDFVTRFEEKQKVNSDLPSYLPNEFNVDAVVKRYRKTIFEN